MFHLKKKVTLEEQLVKIEKIGNIWLEPMSKFIQAAHQAHQVANSKNLAAKRDFLKNAGWNFRLSSRTLQFSYYFPWNFLKKPAPITAMWAREDLTQMLELAATNVDGNP